MLKETAEEKGCFSGCLTFLIVGGFLGLIVGMIALKKMLPFDSVVSGALGGMIGLIIGACAGGVVGLIWGRFTTKKRQKEEDF
ncbi:MAG: hypothetical protein RDV48_09425 [Candidatus Eremiobacteraeota bacterium]|nr:hypothetical protein [Candidatus Eremiobacteraeota bacterium]